jgi:Family of unknown function (DUF6252)
MKKLLFILGISIVFFTSCIPNPTEDPDPPVPPFISQFRADYSDQTFVGTTTQAIVNDDYLAITGMKGTGEFFQITMPNPEVGTYTWSDFDPSEAGFAMIFSQGSGNVPYLAARDDIGEFADFPDYTDTAQLTISSIDTINKRVVGTFKFTGVRFADGGAAVDTKVFTNGSFALNYLDEAPSGPGNNTFTAKLDDNVFTPTAINGLSNSGRISIIGRRGSIETIGINVISTITPGDYDLGSSDDYVGQYIRDATPQGSSFSAEQGTLTIISHDTTAKRIIGTFDFIVSSVLEPGVTYEVSEGAFDITYQ